jgi:hypothetical protein
MSARMEAFWVVVKPVMLRRGSTSVANVIGST